MFDVLVIGGGPSGAIAGLVLARAGARVCLVDRATFPRPKLCGDTLNPAAVAILERLGVLDGVAAQALGLDGMVVTGEGVAVETRYPGALRGLAIGRDVLDHTLLGAAAGAGVDVREGTAARQVLTRDERSRSVVCGARCAAAGSTSTTSRGVSPTTFDIPARITIAADGRRSAIAFGLGLLRHPPAPRRWAIGARAANVGALRGFGEMHIRRDHYVGVAPLPGGTANLCLVRQFASASDTRLHDPASLLIETARRDPMLGDRFAEAALVTAPMILGPLAVDAVTRIPPDGLLLAGDAAGFIDPMTGDGLRFALRGAELAAYAALRALEHGWNGVHASLERERTREFARKWRFNRLLRGLIGSPLGVRGATIGGRVAPAAVRALVRMAGDCSVARAV